MTKKELLFRRNKGKQCLDNYLCKIKSLCLIEQDDILLLSLEESDNVRSTILGKHRDGRIKDYTSDEMKRVIEELKKAEGEYVIFIDEDWKYCGALLVKNLNIIRDDFLFGVIRDTVVFIRRELDRRIELDCSEYNRLYEIEYSDVYLL